MYNWYWVVKVALPHYWCIVGITSCCVTADYIRTYCICKFIQTTLLLAIVCACVINRAIQVVWLFPVSINYLHQPYMVIIIKSKYEVKRTITWCWIVCSFLNWNPLPIIFTTTGSVLYLVSYHWSSWARTLSQHCYQHNGIVDNYSAIWNSLWTD